MENSEDQPNPESQDPKFSFGDALKKGKKLQKNYHGLSDVK